MHVFMMTAGGLFTVERCANWNANGLSAQGSAINNGHGNISSPFVRVLLSPRDAAVERMVDLQNKGAYQTNDSRRQTL